MSADSDALRTVQQLGLTPAEEQYLLTVARGEGFYGLGWGNPNAKTIQESADFGIDPRAGVGSNNWGAVQGVGSAGSFPHIDHHGDGAPYVGTFKRYNTSLESAANTARILLKSNVRSALNTGFYPGAILPKNPTPTQRQHFELRNRFAGQVIEPIRAAVYSQQDNGYFELNPDAYLDAAKRNYAALTIGLGWPDLLSKPPAPPEMIAATPLAGSPSSALPPLSSGEPSVSSLNGNESLPEAGFLRGEKYSVPGIQDGKKT